MKTIANEARARIGLQSCGHGIALIMTGLSFVAADKEERDDLAARLIAIDFQIARMAGMEPTLNFDEQVALYQRELDIKYADVTATLERIEGGRP